MHPDSFQGRDFFQGILTLDNDTLRHLQRDVPPTDVLSLILDVNPVSPGNQGGGLKLRARHLLEGLGASAALVERVMADLDAVQRGGRTRVSYLWEEHGQVRQCCVWTQIALPESARLGAPDTETLTFALESGPRTVIALVGNEWARLFSVWLGEITELYRLENVTEPNGAFREHGPSGPVLARLDDTDPHQDGGRRLLGWDTDHSRLGGRAAQQDLQLYRALVTRLSQLSQVGAFERLIVAGSERARANLIWELPPALARALCGEVIARGDVSASALLDEARSALEHAENVAQHVLLDEAQERGVAGPAATLKAVQEGRVSDLLVDVGGPVLTLWRGEAGVLSGTPPPPTFPGQQGPPGLDLRALLPELREQYGLHVRFLTGQQATRLHDQLGGLAGLLRY